MSIAIYQRVAVTDAGDVIPGAEYTVINENTGVAAPIYSDRTGSTLKTAPYFADSVGTIQFYIAQGTTYRVAASGGVGTYTDRYVYGISEAVLVQANGNVGIGTSSPARLLDVKKSTVGDIAAFRGSDAARELVIRSSTTTLNGDTYTIDANSSNGVVAFATGSSERMRLDSVGNLLLGKSAYSISTTGVLLRPTGSIWGTASNDVAAELNRLNSVGEIVRFRSDGAVVGAVGTTNNCLYIGTTSASSGVTFQENALFPTTGGVSRVNATNDLGGSTYKWKDLHLSGVAYIDNQILAPGTYTQTTSGAANVNIRSDGLMRLSTSSLRYKNSVEDAQHGLAELLTLRPVTYKGNNDGETIFGGLIAEEVHDAGLAEFVVYNEDGQPNALAYSNMVSICIKAIQEQQALIEALTARIEALEK